MEKLSGLILLIVGVFLVPFGIGIPMVLFGCRMMSK